MIIPANPYKIYYSYFKSSKNVQTPFTSLFSLSFYNNGREALFALCRSLGIERDDRVVFPALICRSAVDILQCNGIRIEYADIDDNLNYNTQELEKKLARPNIKVVVAVNYFGFPADIKKIKQVIGARPIHVVEDCAHTPIDALLIQDRRVGLRSAGVVFSIRKTHPVLNGGVMVSNQGAPFFERNASSRCQYLRETRFVLLKVLEGIASVIGWPNPYGQGIIKKIRDALAVSKESNKSNHDVWVGADIKQGICPFLVVKLLEDSLTLKEFSNIRRKNFQHLSNKIVKLGYRLLLQKLPDCAIPMALPLHDPGGKINNWLREKGVGSYRWPGTELPREVEEGLYETAIRFANTTTLLPIHQDVNETHIKKMVAILSDYLAR